MDEFRLAILAFRRFTLGANGVAVGDEFLGSCLFLFRPGLAQFISTVFGGKLVIAVQELFDLNNVICQRFGGCVDGGESASDDDDW